VSPSPIGNAQKSLSQEFDRLGRPVVFRILEGDRAGLEDYRAQFSAAAETIVEADKPDLPLGQCRFEEGHHRCTRKPMPCTEMEHGADKAVAAVGVVITPSCPVVVFSEKIQHEIQHLRGFAGHIRGHGHLLMGAKAIPSIGARGRIALASHPTAEHWLDQTRVVVLTLPTRALTGMRHRRLPGLRQRREDLAAPELLSARSLPARAGDRPEDLETAAALLKSPPG
jgi:hypothetical protein